MIRNSRKTLHLLHSQNRRQGMVTVLLEMPVWGLASHWLFFAHNYHKKPHRGL
jgi:hypothetical protein